MLKSLVFVLIVIAGNAFGGWIGLLLALIPAGIAWAILDYRQWNQEVRRTFERAERARQAHVRLFRLRYGRDPSSDAELDEYIANLPVP